MKIKNNIYKVLIVLILVIHPVQNFCSPPPPTIRMNNDYLKLIVDKNTGRFILKAIKRAPVLDYRPKPTLLLYEWYPPPTHTTIRIDEEDHIFGSKNGQFIKPLEKEGENILCIWKKDKIAVMQNLRFVHEATSGKEDSLEISYLIKNKDKKSRRIGIRIMLDTYLGTKDGAPFRIPFIGSIIKERKFKNIEVPPYWFACDDLERPTVQAQGTLKLKDSFHPDQVIFASAIRFLQRSWDFQIDPDRYLRRTRTEALDSAVAIYWFPREIEPEGTLFVKTQYGFFESTVYKAENLNVALSSPVKVSEEPFYINADMQNTGKDEYENILAEVILPDGLKLFQDDKLVKELGALKPKEMARASWNVVSKEDVVSEEVSYSIKIINEKKEKKEKKGEKGKKGEKKAKKKLLTSEDFLKKNIIINKDLKEEDENIKDVMLEELSFPIITDKIEDDLFSETEPKRVYKDSKPMLVKQIVYTNLRMVTNIIEKTIIKKGKEPGVDDLIQNDWILFNYKSSKIDKEDRKYLDKIGKSLKGFKVKYLIVKGHTDSLGTQRYNLWLSQMRTKSIIDYLVEKKYVSRNKCVFQTYGKKRPRAKNITARGRQKNRRIEIEIILSSD